MSLDPWWGALALMAIACIALTIAIWTYDG